MKRIEKNRDTRKTIKEYNENSYNKQTGVFNKWKKKMANIFKNTIENDNVLIKTLSMKTKIIWSRA